METELSSIFVFLTSMCVIFYFIAYWWKVETDTTTTCVTLCFKLKFHVFILRGRISGRVTKSSGVINCFVIHDKGDDYMVENVGLNMS